MDAVEMAAAQQPSLFRDPQHFAVAVEHRDGNDYTIHVYRHDTPDALESYTDVRVAVQTSLQPANSRLSDPNILTQPALLGTDVAAFLAGYAALKKSRFSRVDITAEAVVVQQFIYGGELRYGIAFTPMWHIHGTIGCDLQTLVDPETYTATPISAIC